MIQQMTTIYVDDMKPEFVSAEEPEQIENEAPGEPSVTIRLKPLSVDIEHRSAHGITFFGTLPELEAFAAAFYEAVYDARAVVIDRPRFIAI